jgi:xanthine dehydrogenase accessory factor
LPRTCVRAITIDIFVEPMLPKPQVVIFGASAVSIAVADFAWRLGFAVTVCAPAAEQASFADVDRRIEGYALPVEAAAARYIIVSTQGRDDEVALLAALSIEADYVGFVGSRRKTAALKSLLSAKGAEVEHLEKLKAAAGLHLGAITPDEIAVSIVAEIVAMRRGKYSRDAAIERTE